MNYSKPKLFSWLTLPFLVIFVMLMPAGHVRASVIYSDTSAPISPMTAVGQSLTAYIAGSIGTTTISSITVVPTYTTSHYFTPPSSNNLYMYATDARGHTCTSTNYLDITTMVFNVNGVPPYGVIDGSLNWLTAPTHTFTYNFSGCTMFFGTGDYIQYYMPSAFGGSFFDAKNGSGGNEYVIVNSAPPADVCTNGSTGDCIDTVSPPDDPTYANPEATSTTFAFNNSGFITPNDYVSGAFVEQKYQPDDYDQLASALCSVGGCYTTFDFPISTSGTFSNSTSTDIERFGNYTMITSIKSPYQIFGITVPFFYNTLTSTSTAFQVSTSTQLDNVKTGLQVAYSEAGITNAGIVNVTSYCTFSSLSDLFNLNQKNNLFTCVLGAISVLTIPTSAQIAGFGTNLQNSFLARVPFGYVTRFTVIASTVATSSLPTLAISLPNGFPGAGESFDLTPWNALMGTTSMLSTATSTQSGKTLRQIVDPGWGIFVLACLGLAIVHRVLGFDQESNTSKV